MESSWPTGSNKMWIYTGLGKKAQVKTFEQTIKVMETRKPGIGASAGL
jgi:hypothetical protein